MIIDIIVIILILCAAFSGYKKGLVGILASFVGLVISIVLAFMLQGAIADMLYNDTSLGRTIEQSINKNLTQSFNKKIEDETEGNTFYNNILKNIKTEDEISNVSKQISKFILKGISFIAIFIITFIICYIIRMILNLVFDLPILSQINEIGGIAVGSIQAILKLWIALAIVSFLSPLPLFDSIDTIIRDTTITNILYNNNIFVGIIKSTLNI